MYSSVNTWISKGFKQINVLKKMIIQNILQTTVKKKISKYKTITKKKD